MWHDDFLANALLFGLGVAAAFFWLRTGMVRRGALLLAVVTISADVALVARFVYEELGPWFTVPLTVLQAAALGSVAMLGFKLVNRRWAADSKHRRRLMAQAVRHYLRDELAEASRLYQRIRRADPWSVPATLGYANVLWRQGALGRARAMYRRARRLDRKGTFRDLVAEQLRRAAAPPPQPPTRRSSKVPRSSTSPSSPSASASP